MNSSLKTKTLAVFAGAVGLYSLGKSLWYLQQGKGCRKCEITQAVLGLGVVGLSGWVLLRR